MKLELVSSTTNAEMKKYGWNDRIKVNGTAILGCSRGLNVLMINGTDGQLRTGTNEVFDTYENASSWNKFVTYMNTNISTISMSRNDILVMIIIDCAPYLSESKPAQDKLKMLGVSEAMIRILSEYDMSKPNPVLKAGWIPWVFAWQNGKILIDATSGDYGTTISQYKNDIELTSEREARIKKEQEEEQRKVAEAQKEREAAAHTARLMASQKAEQDKIIAALKAEMGEKVNASEQEKEELRKTLEEAKKEGQRRDREATKAAASAREKEAEYVRKQRESVLSQLRAQKEELLRRQGLLDVAEREIEAIFDLSKALGDFNYVQAHYERFKKR